MEEVFGNLFNSLKVNHAQNFVRCPSITGYISPRIRTGLAQEAFIFQHTVEQRFQFFITLDREPAFCLQELNGFLEFLVLRSKDYRNAIYGSFQRIMNTPPI